MSREDDEWKLLDKRINDNKPEQSYEDWQKYFDQMPGGDDEAVGLDGEQLGIMCMRDVDDSFLDEFQFFYKGKKVSCEDIRIIIYGGE